MNTQTFYEGIQAQLGFHAELSKSYPLTTGDETTYLVICQTDSVWMRPEGGPALSVLYLKEHDRHHIDDVLTVIGDDGVHGMSARSWSQLVEKAHWANYPEWMILFLRQMAGEGTAYRLKNESH